MSKRVFDVLKILMVVAMFIVPMTALAQQGDTPAQGTTGQQDSNAQQGTTDGQAGAAQIGRTAAQARGINNTFVRLNPGEVHWYAFRYDGHYELREVESTDADDGEMESVFTPSDILVWADSVPDNSINFAVWTRNNLNAAGAFDVDNFGTDLAAQPQDGTGPVGFDAECGQNVRGDICWTGTFYEAGVYYIRVSHDATFGQRPVFYRLFVEGVDVRTDLSGELGLNGQRGLTGTAQQGTTPTGSQDMAGQETTDGQQDVGAQQDVTAEQEVSDLVAGQLSIAPRRIDRDLAGEYTFDAAWSVLNPNLVQWFVFQDSDSAEFGVIAPEEDDGGGFFMPSSGE